MISPPQKLSAKLSIPQRFTARLAAGVPVPGPPGPEGPAGLPRVVQDEGVALTARDALNFVGAGVTATDDAANNRTLITIPGASAAGVIVCVIDGGGAVPSLGTKAVVQVPYSGTITGWTLLANVSGNAQITVKKADYTGYPTTVSIVASAPPAIIGAVKATSAALTGWTTAFAAGDVFEFVLDSVTTIQRLTVELSVTKG